MAERVVQKAGSRGLFRGRNPALLDMPDERSDRLQESLWRSRGFNPRPVHFLVVIAGVVQLVERLHAKEEVCGFEPHRPLTIFGGLKKTSLGLSLEC